MAKTDMPSKRLIQLRPDDWAKMVLKDTRDIFLTEMKPDKNPKVESRLDSLFWVGKGKETFILNIEPQGYYESSLPARMLRYRADIWEYTMGIGMGAPSIKQVVVFFNPKDDNKLHEIKDERADGSNISFSYDVIKIWEIKKDYIIGNNLLGLYSLLPLMEIEPGESDEEVIEKSVKTIETIEDKALREDALAAMSIMSSDRYSSSLIQKYVRREMIMNSPLFEEWAVEERKEGAVINSRETIIDLLVEKFDFVPKSLREKIATINDKDIMSDLTRKIIKTSSLEEYEDLIDKVLGVNPKK